MANYHDMDFGRVLPGELGAVDFSLAAEPAINKSILPRRPAPSPRVYLGCAKWGRREWVRRIYPPGTKEKDFLRNYVEHYNSVELNATHYKIYGERGTRKWAAEAGSRDFLFCPKMYQGITHRGRLNGKAFLTNEFLRGIAGFEKRLGPVLVQLSDGFSPKRRQELFDFLSLLPKDLQFFLELRHRDWFAKPAEREGLFGFLRDNQIGAVITDTAGRRDCVHMRLTLPKTFIRFVGNSLHATDYTRTEAWVDRMKYWLDSGLQELYFFVHMPDEAMSPALSFFLAERINAVCGLQLPKPKFIGGNEKPF